MGIFKKFFSVHQQTQKEEVSSTPTTSNAATPITSPAGSIINVEAQAKPVHNRYYNDPMRISKKPDTIGNFLDPMGGSGSYSVSRDVTNTGA